MHWRRTRPDVLRGVLFRSDEPELHHGSRVNLWVI